MRVLVPELLDLLPADDPRAIRSRRDLVLINAIMRQQALMAGALSRCPPPRILADLGGGDGRFMLSVARRLAKHWPNVQVLIVDRQDIVGRETRAGFEALGWSCETQAGDVFEAMPDADIITANLFLHHFDDAALSRLLTAIVARTSCFVACEPRRNSFALLAAHLVGVLGCNDVTGHDAVASVKAGFAGQDLSRLWPQGGGWRLAEAAALPFSHVFRAQRDV
ncbi:MAG: hypothetical protein RL274_2013 [Pseudomonadota bacterium]